MELESLFMEKRSEIAVNILTDSIIMDRVYRATNDIIRAASGKESEIWKAMEEISGFTCAFHLYGIPLGVRPTGELSDIYYDNFEKDHDSKDDRKDASLLAKQIIVEWEHFLKNEKQETLTSFIVEERTRLITDILTDAVILDRIDYATGILIRAGLFEHGEWDAIESINGYANAFHLFGIFPDREEDDKLAISFGEIFNGNFRKDIMEGKKDARLIAEQILLEWKNIQQKAERNKV